MSEMKYFGIDNCFKIAEIAAQLVIATDHRGLYLESVLRDFDAAYTHVKNKLEAECDDGSE